MDIGDYASYVVWFMIYSFIGWIYESGLRSIKHKRLYNSGFLSGPYIPIYGFGAVIDILLLGKYNNPLYIFLFSAIINCILEYFTSYFMELLFHARWWDYSDKPLNINGRIYYLGFIAFGSFATIVILYFQPWLVLHTTDLMSDTQIVITSLIGILVMSVDTYTTVINLKSFEEKLNELISALDELKSRTEEKVENSLLYEKIKSLRSKFTLQDKRIFDAFPELKFKNMKYNAKEILDIVKEQNKKLFINK